MSEKLALYGFNNLTKSLTFNIYDVCITETDKDREEYIEYIDEEYNSARLTEILVDVTNRIGAKVLNISKQDYEPQGASVTILISEEEVPLHLVDASCNKGVITPLPSNIVSHLDKSHITVHTYPESHPHRGISTFRLDIDVSTCGEISPINALEFLMECFNPDISTIDYKVRGFTRNNSGDKIFLDHEIESITDFLDKPMLDKFSFTNTDNKRERIFNTKLKLKELELNDYLFNKTKDELSDESIEDYLSKVSDEMEEIYYGWNIEK